MIHVTPYHPFVSDVSERGMKNASIPSDYLLYINNYYPILNILDPLAWPTIECYIYIYKYML